jgi:hypothetical protein
MSTEMSGVFERGPLRLRERQGDGGRSQGRGLPDVAQEGRAKENLVKPTNFGIFRLLTKTVFFVLIAYQDYYAAK